MKSFYHVPTAVLVASPPQAAHDAQPTDDPTLSLVIVERWPSEGAQDEWEALAGVVAYPVWDWGKLAPAQMLAAHANKSLVQTPETVGDVMRRLRQTWSAVRP